MMTLHRQDHAGRITANEHRAAYDPPGPGEGVDPDCRGVVQRHVHALLRRHGSRWQCRRLREEAATAADQAADDLMALTSRDPAARGSWEYVADSYVSHRAVTAYRLAHAVLGAAAPFARGSGEDRAELARRISEDAKVSTGVEIHPAASIGRRFALDHAVGTVIGETAVLGDDCYILQGVILGATGIAANATGKRHPTLGDRVQVGAFARLLGPITVGGDTRIGPHAVVVIDVPAGSRLRLLNQCQVRSPRAVLEIFGVVPLGAGWLEVHRSGLADADVRLVDVADRTLDTFPVQIIERAPARLTCRLTGDSVPPADAALRITEPSGERVLVTQVGAVWRALRNSELSLLGR